jgi:hypothetical protein
MPDPMPPPPKPLPDSESLPQPPGPSPGETPNTLPGDPIPPYDSGQKTEPIQGGQEWVVQRRGRFLLVQAEQGFAWVLTGEAGSRRYWHPREQQWICSCQASPTPEAAMAGFDPEAPKAAPITWGPGRCPGHTS